MIATTSSRCSPMRTQLVAEHLGPASGRAWRAASPVRRVEAARLVHLVGLVVLGRRVAVALAGDAVHDHRAVEAAGQREARVSSAATSCPSTGPTYFSPRSSNMSLRRKQVLDAALHAVQRVVDRRRRRPACARSASLTWPSILLVAGRAAAAREMLGQPADGRRVGTAVVVHDDDHRTVGRRRCCSAPPSTCRR